MRVIFVLSLLLAASIAGCLGGGSTMTAKGGLDEATEAAQVWSDTPQLVGVMSIEPFRRIFEEGEGEILVHLDSAQADGRSPAWVYLYQGIDRFIFVVDAAKLGVLAEGWISEDEWGESDGPIEGWNIDSDEAAEILSKEDDWPEPSEDMWTFWALSMWDGEPYWVVEAGNMTGEWEAVVHAGNGTVMEIDEWSWDDMGSHATYTSGYDFDSDTGPVTSTTGGLEISVFIEGPGNIEAHAEGLIASGVITLELLAPNGTLVWDEAISANSFGAGLDWDGAEPGTYTLVARPDGSLTLAQASLSLEAYW